MSEQTNESGLRNQKAATDPGDDAQKISGRFSAVRTAVIDKIAGRKIPQPYLEKVKKILEHASETDRYLLAIKVAEDVYAINRIMPEEISYLLSQTGLAQQSGDRWEVRAKLRDAHHYVLANITGTDHEFTLSELGEHHVKKIMDTYGRHHHKFYYAE